MKNQAIAIALLLAGCGSATPNSNASDTSTAASAGATTPPAGWNATDACKVIDKSAMSAILGSAVSEATLALVHESEGTTAASSECTYLLADGSRASLMMRWSPIADNDEGAVNMTRNGLQQTAKAFGGTVDTVSGVGKAAFWVSKTDSLNVFIGNDKFLIVNTPSGLKSREQAIAVARKLGA
jgi:hypothetical protein